MKYTISFILVGRTLRIACFANEKEVCRASIGDALAGLLPMMLRDDPLTGDVRWLRACRNASRAIYEKTNQIKAQRAIRDCEIKRARI
jgi:hypothetical protein